MSKSLFQMAKVVLTPVLLAQGVWVRLRIPKLLEPPGARAGKAGTGAVLRLLILGDSSAAGVGSYSQERALLGNITGKLSQIACVQFNLIARTGDTTADAIYRLKHHGPARYDIAVIALGVNDITRRIPMAHWLEQQRELYRVLQKRYGCRHIVVSGVPPIHQFTALPQPLRWFLGEQAREYDRALARLIASIDGVEYLPMQFFSPNADFGIDQFHPGPIAYQEWGEHICQQIYGIINAEKPSNDTENLSPLLH